MMPSGSYPDPRLKVLLDDEYGNLHATIANSGSYPDGRLIVGESTKFEQIPGNGTERLRVLKCEYCGAGYVADLIKERGIKCPGCTAWASPDQLKSALDEMEEKYSAKYVNATGTASVAAAAWQGINKLVAWRTE